MRIRYVLLLIAFVLTLADTLPTGAQAPAQPKEPVAPKEPLFSETDGSVTIANQKIEYKATAGMLPATDKAGKAKAKIFFTAYTRKTDDPPAKRRLMFCYNGGPGTSSAYVHLGFFGPRRVLINDDGLSAPRPVQMVNNDCCLLDLTDIVCIDPVSTGLSRPEKADEAVLFHGLEEDTYSVGEFIRAYVAKYNRQESPTYIAGESYGTLRSASLSSYIQGRGGVKLAGVVLISSVLDWQTLSFGPGNDVPYYLFLPTYAVAAWHHGKLDKAWAKDLATVVGESEKFAFGPYAEALGKGNRVSDYERKAIAKQMATLTGLSEELVLQLDLRVSDNRFRSELLRDRQEVIGRLDTRVTAKAGGAQRGADKGGDKGGDKAAKGARRGGDPSNALVSGIFSEAMRGYLQDGLQYKTDDRYQLSAGVQPWSYGRAGTNRYANVAPRLRAALEKDKSLRVLVANGYCDMATPFAATNYTFAHLGPRDLMDRVTLTYYDAGHMIYTHEPSRRKLHDDLVRFLSTEALDEKKK